jgi:lipoate-protein ligase A
VIRWRELDTGYRDAASNVALDDALLKAHGRSEQPFDATLRFLSFRPACVLVGYNQVVRHEARESYCREAGIEVNRRITGGGAIYLDPSQVGWEVIATRSSPLFPLSVERLYERIASAVVVALNRLGVSARFKPRNDIEAGGKKISGTGGTEYKGAFLFQGTLLVRDEIEELVRSLRIPVEKLSHRELGSLRERVTCLERELGYVPPREDIKRAIREGFASIFGVEIQAGELTPLEARLAEERLRVFSRAAWVNRVDQPMRAQGLLESSHRCRGGVVRVAMVVNKRDRVVRATYISGDFFAEPKEKLLDLERLLKNIPMRRGSVLSRVTRFLSEGSLNMLGIEPGDLLRTFEDIFGKWDHVSRGFTIEEANRVMQVGEGFEAVLSRRPNAFLFPYCAKAADCDLRYDERCSSCGRCEVGEGYALAAETGLAPVTIQSFEHLWATLMRLKSAGTAAYVGSCCRTFYARHRDEFEAAGLPAILLDIESDTCFDLGRVRDAYQGSFANKTELDMPLIRKVLERV